MTQEELQKKYDRLLDKARRVRGVQKEYFKYRLVQDLELARRLERELDLLISEEVKVQKSNQSELFNDGK
jgi:hypothetical protein